MNMTDQDIEVLRYLHAVKVATYAQIHRDIYPDKSLKTAYNRVANMSKNRLISGSYDRLGLPVEKVLSVSKQGFQKFVASGSEHRVELKSDAVVHDLALVDIRHSMLNTGRVKEYYTENQIQTWWPIATDDKKSSMAKLRSDALAKVTFSKGDLWVAIEYEANGKSDKRYDSLIKQYYLCLDIPLVLYVCDSQGLIDKIDETERKIYQGEYPKLFYQLKQEIKAGETLTFTNRDRKNLRFEAKATRESIENYPGTFPA